MSEPVYTYEQQEEDRVAIEEGTYYKDPPELFSVTKAIKETVVGSDSGKRTNKKSLFNPFSWFRQK